jgi:hypothetical protein
MKKVGRTGFIAAACLAAWQLAFAETVQVPAALCVESDSLRWVIGADACTSEFVDKTTGVNYCTPRPVAAFVRVKKAGRYLDARHAELVDGRLLFDFGDAGVVVALKITGVRHSLAVEVLSVAGEGVEECVFAHLPLTVKGVSEEPFAACALALNLQTEVRGLPQAAVLLEARCYPRFGFAGAKVTLVGGPQKELRRMLQDAVTAAPDLPHSPIGGPWALDAEINRGSYLFAPVSEKTADEWIRLARSMGINQIDFDGMSRYGDAEPYPELYQNGRAGLKRVVDQVHAAGLKAGLHTYAFFIDKRCPWVTPVPDARLGKDATFTLAEALGASNQTVVVVEPTAGMSAITGFFVRNSATVQVDDELITYSEVSQTAPFAFTKCRRGACGTRAAPHAQGAIVQHLKECFGRFTPDADSTLLAEVAARQAQTVNDCGFDMMYIDALDGEDILGGAANGWHYGSKFVYELWKRFDHPMLLEMSTMHHHLWAVRSRMGAWDHPTRSHKRFIDIHCAANAHEGRSFLPMHLGWWAIKTGSGSQGEPTFADDIEYLCCKAIGSDVGLSLMGVTPGMFTNNATLQRLGGITRNYEALRHAKAVPESVKARLKVPGDEFTLDQDSAGTWRFRPARYEKHKVASLSDGSAAWVVTNTFARQPLRLRLEVLMSAEPYATSNAIAMAGFTSPAEFTDRTQAKGVTAALGLSTDVVKCGASSILLTATNARPERSATWAGFGKTFAQPLKLGGERALGVWVYGDGQGEVLNFQLRCPAHVVAGLGEHYVAVDFTGWRYFELIEPEGERYADYQWPYGGAYAIYRERVDYNQIERLTVWVNNLPAGGGVKCYLSPVVAVPLVKAKIRNPRVTVGDRTLSLPVEMESGSYLELYSPGNCKVYGSDGSLLQEVKVAGDIPEMAAGANALGFACERSANEVNPRVQVTTFTSGTPLTQ